MVAKKELGSIESSKAVPDDELVQLKKGQFEKRLKNALGLSNTESVREVRRDIARIMTRAVGRRTATVAARELDRLRERVLQLEAEQLRLRTALEAEGLIAPPRGEAADDEPFGLPDPDPLADRAPSNPRIARLVARLRSASADEIAVRAEKADEERLAMMKGTAKKL